MRGLKPIISLILESFYTLNRLESGVYSKLEIFIAMNSLNFAILLDKRSFHTIDSLKSRNYVVLLIYLDLKNDTLLSSFIYLI